jgi:hypothetical protein
MPVFNVRCVLTLRDTNVRPGTHDLVKKKLIKLLNCKGLILENIEIANITQKQKEHINKHGICTIFKNPIPLKDK